MIDFLFGGGNPKPEVWVHYNGIIGTIRSNVFRFILEYQRKNDEEKPHNSDYRGFFTDATTFNWLGIAASVKTDETGEEKIDVYVVLTFHRDKIKTMSINIILHTRICFSISLDNCDFK